MTDRNTASRTSLGTYTWAARVVDSLGIAGFFGAVLTNVYRLAAVGPELFDGVTGGAVLAGYLAADVGSGVVHWFFDTWLSARTPVLGSMFVRPFREHHVDPLAITRHDFVETNGSNCLATVPLLLGASLLDPAAGAAQRGGVVFVVALSLGVFATNQFHSWAHRLEPPRWITLLQRSGLALRPEHHARHHASPYLSHYCITTGWMNPLLDGIGFFRGLERAITLITGVPPRLEDGALSS